MSEGSRSRDGGNVGVADLFGASGRRIARVARHPLDLRAPLAVHLRLFAQRGASTPVPVVRHLAVWWLLYSRDAVNALLGRPLEDLPDRFLNVLNPTASQATAWGTGGRERDGEESGDATHLELLAR